jgi:hypothetical protein
MNGIANHIHQLGIAPKNAHPHLIRLPLPPKLMQASGRLLTAPGPDCHRNVNEWHGIVLCRRGFFARRHRVALENEFSGFQSLIVISFDARLDLGHPLEQVVLGFQGLETLASLLEYWFPAKFADLVDLGLTR